MRREQKWMLILVILWTLMILMYAVESVRGVDNPNTDRSFRDRPDNTYKPNDSNGKDGSKSTSQQGGATRLHFDITESSMSPDQPDEKSDFKRRRKMNDMNCKELLKAVDNSMTCNPINFKRTWIWSRWMNDAGLPDPFLNSFQTYNNVHSIYDVSTDILPHKDVFGAYIPEEKKFNTTLRDFYRQYLQSFEPFDTETLLRDDELLITKSSDIWKGTMRAELTRFLNVVESFKQLYPVRSQVLDDLHHYADVLLGFVIEPTNIETQLHSPILGVMALIMFRGHWTLPEYMRSSRKDSIGSDPDPLTELALIVSYVYFMQVLYALVCVGYKLKLDSDLGKTLLDAYCSLCKSKPVDDYSKNLLDSLRIAVEDAIILGRSLATLAKMFDPNMGPQGTYNGSYELWQKEQSRQLDRRIEMNFGK